MGEGGPSGGGWRGLGALWARLAPRVGQLWKEMSSPAGLAILGFALTSVLGSWVADHLKNADAARDAATQDEKDRTARIDKIESQLSSSLQQRMTYVHLISEELARDDAVDDLKTDWPAYRQQYVNGTVSVLLGNLSLQKEMEAADPAGWHVFSRYLLSWVEPRLEDEDYCLSAARDAYIDASAQPGERSRQAGAVLSACGRPDLDALSACVQDLVINIHYAVMRSEAAASDAKRLLSRQGALASPGATDGFAGSLVKGLKDDCGKEPAEGS